jgi:hypothetical protein
LCLGTVGIYWEKVPITEVQVWKGGDFRDSEGLQVIGISGKQATFAVIFDGIPRANVG